MLNFKKLLKCLNSEVEDNSKSSGQNVSPSIPVEGVFDKLLHFPRYTETLTELLGKEYLIPDSVSFYYAHREIFEHEIYKFSCEHDCPIILDCGANTGVSVYYFKKLFPNCNLLAVEADPLIFNILKRNVESGGFKNITLLQGAISTEKGKLSFLSEGADAGRLSFSGEAKSDKCVLVDCIDLDDIILDHVDFLKIDIEGAEVDVVLNSKKLGLVERMFIEYHSFLDSKQRLDELLKKISEVGFRYYMTVPTTPKNPFEKVTESLGMDLQINISCVRI